MKKILTMFSILTFSILLVGCAKKTTSVKDTSNLTNAPTTTIAPITNAPTTTKSNEDNAKAMYRKMLSSICQYTGKTIEVEGALTMNDSSLSLLNYSVGINLGENSTQTIYVSLNTEYNNLFPSLTAIVNLKVVKPGQFEDYLYLNANKDFIIFVKYLLEMNKEGFNQEEFFNRDDIKNETDKDIKVNLNELLMKEIKITDNISITIRTIISQVFSSQSIGSTINSLLSILKSYNLLDKDYLLNIPFIRETLINAIYDIRYEEGADSVKLKEEVTKMVDDALKVLDYFTLKEVPSASPYYLGYETETINLLDLPSDIIDFLKLSGQSFNVKLDLCANLKDDYFLDNITIGVLKVEETELAVRETSLIEFKNTINKTLNENIKVNEEATEISFSELINLFK